MRILLVLLLCAFNFSPAAEPSVAVPLGDPVYAFISQASIKYGVDLPNLYTRPYTRKQAARFLHELEKKRPALNRIERQELDYFREEFSRDLQALESGGQYREKHVYYYNNPGTDDHLIVDLGLKDSAGYLSGSGEKRMTGCLTGGIRGAVRGRIAFQSVIHVCSEINSLEKYFQQDYEPVNGYPYNTFGDQDSSGAKSWDTFISGVFFESRWFNLELGVDRMRWGPAEAHPLTLSGETPPLALLKAEMDFWRFHYIHTINILKGYKYKDKYLYAHRLEWALPLKFRLGVNEMLVYGDNCGDGDPANPGTRFDERSLDYVYAIPFVPYYFAQHYNGDRENMGLSFDLAFSLVRNLKLYAELFLDDLISPLDLFDDYWSNKWAATVGGRYYFPLDFPDISLLAEYTHVEPWVYTHFFGESHRFRHYGQSLGTSVGPNGDEVLVSLHVTPARKIKPSLYFRTTRQDTGSKGDSITDVFTAGDPTTKSFLGGSVETRTALGAAVGWEISRLIDFRFFFEQDLNGDRESRVSGALDFYW